jgi:DNA-binding FadR family transcriptional regulator
MPTTDNPPAYRQVADGIRYLILSGDLLPGERLPVELDLAVRFGVGRSTIREAIRLLTAENLTVTMRGVTGGTFVNHPEPDQISESLVTGLDFLTLAEELTVDELLEARELLEVPAARLASTRRTEAQLERILAQLPNGSNGKPSPSFESRRGFHLRIVEAVGNQLLAVMTLPVFRVLQTRFLRDEAPQELWRRVDQEHRRIAEAIAAGDADLAASEMSEHLQHLRQTYGRIDRRAGRSA